MLCLKPFCRQNAYYSAIVIDVFAHFRRLIEVLTGRWTLSNDLRAPAISRLQKIHNVSLVFNELARRGVTPEWKGFGSFFWAVNVGYFEGGFFRTKPYMNFRRFHFAVKWIHIVLNFVLFVGFLYSSCDYVVILLVIMACNFKINQEFGKVLMVFFSSQPVY